MRRTIDLPEELVNEARAGSGLRTIRETVIAGLEELVRKARREELRAMAGAMDLDLDLAQTRKKRV